MAAARLAGRARPEDEDLLVPPPSPGRDEPINPTRDANRFVFPSITSWFRDLDKGKAVTVVVLVYVNLINYMDRSTVAGMLERIKQDKNFNITQDKYLGLLQTAFVVCYMLFAPVFGYLGDRHSRKWLLAIGISFWSLSTLIGSFMHSFWMFLMFRALVGVGEASYSVVAPAIISDLFAKDQRSSVLALFYFAIPVGTGLGYIVGSEVAGATDDWRWGLRVTPIMGALAVFMIVFLMVDPERGAADGSKLKPTSPISDLKSLVRNKSYVFATIAFTCVCYVAGALMWWGPNFAFVGAKAACGNKANCGNITLANVSFKFGIVMTLSGLLGVPAGSYISQIIRHQVPNADPIVCAVTLLVSVPILFFGFVTANYSLSLCYGLTFFAGLLLNANWSIVSDMTLYIVIPTRRGVATATQILVSHMFGDAFSPYLIGALADSFKPLISPNSNLTVSTDPTTTLVNIPFLPGTGQQSMSYELTPEEYDLEFRALEYSLFTCCFFQALGAFFFFVMSWYVMSDKSKAERQIACNADILGPENQPTPDRYREDVDFREGTQPIYRPPTET
jgi:MFS family permease